MTVKTYASRDSATSALRKLGLQARDYNLFINKVGDKFECRLGAAIKHLEDLKAPKRKVTKSSHVEHQKPLATTKNTNLSGVGAVTRSLILQGKTKAEIWEIIQPQFNLHHGQRYYPAWYRCEMKRKGLLPRDA